MMTAPLMTAAELVELERLEKEATPGPWEWSDSSRDPDEPNELPYVPQGSTLGDTLIMLDDTYENSRADCAIIAALRNAFPALLATVRALQEREREWVASMPRCDHYDCSNRATRQSVPGKDYTRCDDCGPAGVTWVDLPHAHLIRSAP